MNKTRPCILLIDDSPLELRVLTMILSKMYDIKAASTGEAGIETAMNNDIDLILLDLNMPETSGFEVLIKLKDCECTAHIPVIIVTSSDSSNDEVRGLALGASDFIRKPLDAVVSFRISMCLQLINQMKMIEKFGLIDGLTGVNNRRSFDQTIKAEWSRAMRSSEPLGLMIVDFDKFKRFNDTYGHINGDICLKTISEVMVRTVKRGNDLVFRWGGEEFAIILPKTSLKGVLEVAERVRENIEETEIIMDENVSKITVSIGAGVIVPSADEGFETAYDKFYISVDKALYLAKAKGRNRVETPTDNDNDDNDGQNE